jgi:hypothetical protein
MSTFIIVDINIQLFSHFHGYIYIYISNFVCSVSIIFHNCTFVHSFLFCPLLQ